MTVSLIINQVLSVSLITSRKQECVNDYYENEFMIRSCGFSLTQVLLEVPGGGDSGYFAVAIKSKEVSTIIR